MLGENEGSQETGSFIEVVNTVTESGRSKKKIYVYVYVSACADIYMNVC